MTIKISKEQKYVDDVAEEARWFISLQGEGTTSRTKILNYFTASELKELRDALLEIKLD